MLDRGEGPFEAFVTTGEDYDLSTSPVEYDDFLKAVRTNVREHYAASTS